MGEFCVSETSAVATRLLPIIGAVIQAFTGSVRGAPDRFAPTNDYWGLSSRWTENRGKPERYGEWGTYVLRL